MAHDPSDLQYPCAPLDHGTRSIRLLTLEPGRREDVIRCNIRQFDLDSRPQYDALSYKWDHDNNKHAIFCNNRVVLIGSNLHAFLRQYRDTAGCTSRKLWIDALCINQGDIQERNHQVSQMREIYLSASLTIAWLGESTAHDLEAFRQLAKLQRCRRRQAKYPPDLRPWDSWYELFRKDYWKRMWIIQEIVLARVLSLWCGHLRANADDFKYIGDRLSGVHEIRGAPGWRLLMLRQDWWGCEFVTSNPEIKSSGSEAMLEKFSLMKLSTAFATSQTSDSRDFVYALLGLALDTSIVPDYSKKVSEVIEDVRNSYHVKAREETELEYEWYDSDRPIDPEVIHTENFIAHLEHKMGVTRQRRRHGFQREKDNNGVVELRIGSITLKTVRVLG